MADLLEKYSQDALDRLSTKTTRALDPTFILTIANIIVKMLEECQARKTSPSTIKSRVKSPGLLQRIALRRVQKQETGHFDPDLQEALIEMAQNAQEQDVEDLLVEISA